MISPSSSSSGRQPRHKATRTKELRRYTIRARDEENEERGRDSKTSDILRRCWRDSRESIQGTKGGRKEGRKEGPTPRRGREVRGKRHGRGGRELAFSL